MWAVVTPVESVAGARPNHARTVRRGWAFDPNSLLGDVRAGLLLACD